ncbi:MAG: PRC-barrel domain-containing protein [Actinomycetota bacterium]
MTFQGNIDALPGREVFGSDGRRIGKVGQVFVLEGTDDPTWMTVHTGLFGTHESFVPVAEATERGDELHVPYEKSFVHDAPRIDDAQDLTVEHEAELYRYYGVEPPMQQRPAMDAAAHADAGRRDSDDDRERDDRHGATAAGAAASGAGARDSDDRSAERVGTDGDSGSSGTPSADGPRLRRRIVTEMQTVQVPVQREEFVVEGEDDDDSRLDGQDRSPR